MRSLTLAAVALIAFAVPASPRQDTTPDDYFPVGVRDARNRPPAPSPVPGSTLPAATQPHPRLSLLAAVESATDDDGSTAAPPSIPDHWDRLADCESGEWDRHGTPIPGTATWNIVSPPHYGGLQWTLRTWNAVKPTDAPGNPADATPAQEVAAGETLMSLPWGGWQHWPVCSVKVGLR